MVVESSNQNSLKRKRMLIERLGSQGDGDGSKSLNKNVIFIVEFQNIQEDLGANLYRNRSPLKQTLTFLLFFYYWDIYRNL